MNDERRACANCKHDHKWGILRYSQDGAPLYGPRPCECHCDRWAPMPELGNEMLPAMTQTQIKELWAQTEFLNAQAPAATRMAVAKIMQIGKGDKKPGFWGSLLQHSDSEMSVMERQWPEFMGLMISQLTDMRGAMVRDESKFAHLIAHTDEIVESMRAVAQLADRLNSIYAVQERMLEAVERLTEKVAALTTSELPMNANTDTAPATPSEAVHVFASKSRPLWNEPIPAESEPVDE